MEEAKIVGSGIINGGTYKNIRVAGSGKITGPIQIDDFNVAGSCVFLEDANIKIGHASGSCRFQKDLKGNELHFSGALTVIGETESERLHLSGRGTFNGDMNVGLLRVKTKECVFQNVYGDHIFIESKHEQSKVKDIEATQIEVINVIGNRLSGDEVIVRGSSEFTVIEYRQSLELGKSVRVERIIHL
ncbi:MAG: hypothetical protein PHY42_03830 [Bacilli bacterium]|nr:hypothetical protein [Bacilli bacterium]